jgi:hypothetical protein
MYIFIGGLRVTFIGGLRVTFIGGLRVTFIGGLRVTLSMRGVKFQPRYKRLLNGDRRAPC